MKDAEIEYEDVGKEHYYPAYTSDYAVGYEVFERTVGHDVLYALGYFFDKPLYPVHRICSNLECSPEDGEHDHQEYRESEKLVGDKRIDYVCGIVLILIPFDERLGERSCNEAVFSIGYGGGGVVLAHEFDALLFGSGGLQYWR